MEKLTLTKVYRNDKDKDGKLLKTKDGRAYTKLSVKTKEYGDKWISGFSNFWNEDWEEGMVVGATVEQNGEYLNLKKPDPIKALEDRVTKLEELVMGGDKEEGGHVEDKMPF